VLVEIEEELTIECKRKIEDFNSFLSDVIYFFNLKLPQLNIFGNYYNESPECYAVL
jgi:hypothetical protein